MFSVQKFISNASRLKNFLTLQNLNLNNKKIIIPLLVLISILLIAPLILLVISETGKNDSINKIVARESIFPKARYVADQLIVEYENLYTKDDLAILNNKLSEIGVISQEKLFDTNDATLKNYYLLNLKPDSNLKNIISSLQNFKQIVSFGPNFLIETRSTPQPNDPEFSIQWDLQKIAVPAAWNITHGANSVKVAVVDTGIDYTHPDFAGRTIIKGPDYTDCYEYSNNDASKCIRPKSIDQDPKDDAGHGTHVAGTIGAVTNNKIGVSGMNWNVTLMAIKAIEDKTGDIGNIEKGIVWATDNGAKIINLSLTAVVPCSDPQVKNYQDVVNYARRKGVIIVTAAGNEGQDAKNETPPSCNGVIVVGATDQNDKRATWSSETDASNYGTKVDLSAPGTGIWSTVPLSIFPAGYAPKNGTSMSAPHVTAAIALLLSKKPNLTFDQVKNCLMKGADTIVQEKNKPIGKRLNIQNALNVCQGLPIITQPVSTSSQSVSPSTFRSGAGEIKGEAYVDNNSNGTRDLGERAITNAQITTDGEENLSTTTDTNGNLSFSNIPFGSYTVSIIISGQRAMSTAPFTLDQDQPSAAVSFPVPPGTVATPTPTPNSTSPSTRSGSGATYSCKPRSNNQTSAGAITIGDLVCTPN